MTYKGFHERTDKRELTNRQKEVMDLVCLGKTNAEMGAILALSPCTIKGHLQSCRRKLVAQNKALLVAKYLAPERFTKK